MSTRVSSLPGRPNLLLGAYDLATLGYGAEEFVVSGTARSYATDDNADYKGFLRFLDTWTKRTDVAGKFQPLDVRDRTFVRVLDVHLPVGKTEPRHRHPHGLSVYFTDWDASVTVDGKAAELHHRKAGTFAWSDAVVHTVQNAGKSDGHILRIELKY